MPDSRITRPIIVLGAPRSGTTILRHCLALHPDLWHLPGESHGVLEGPSGSRCSPKMRLTNGSSAESPNITQFPKPHQRARHLAGDIGSATLHESALPCGSFCFKKHIIPQRTDWLDFTHGEIRRTTQNSRSTRLQDIFCGQPQEMYATAKYKNSWLMSKVLYIAGFGRSGSTILSSVLGNHADVVSVGEVTFLLDDWSDRKRRCSCGLHLTECEFWRGLSVVQNWSPDLAAMVRNVDRRTIRALFEPGILEGTACGAYGDFHKKRVSDIRGCSGKSIVVDSSKSARGAAGRILALKKLTDEDVYVLHLVRSGVATFDSMVNMGSNWVIEGHTSPKKFPGASAAFGWTRANAWASIIGRLLGPARYMLLRYEDFLASPGVTLRKIGQFASFDVADLLNKIERQERFQVGHVIGGNRVRMQQTIEVNTGSKSPKSAQLRTRDRLIFALAGGWLQIGYGYREL